MNNSAPTPTGAAHGPAATTAGRDSVDVESLFGEMQPALLRAASRWAPAEAVDDAVQETWIGVLDGVDRFEGRSQLSTWVFGILWRQCCKQWRRVESASTVDGQRTELESRLPEVDPSRVAEGRDSLKRTVNAIGELPDRYREIIVLRDVLDRPAAETCRLLDLTEANQRVLLYRARSRIRRALPDLRAG